MATTLNNMLFALMEFWANKGWPESMWSSAGDFCMMVMKNKFEDWIGDGKAKLGVRDKLSGNQGPNYERVYAAVSSGGAQFNVRAKDHFAFMLLGGRVMAFARKGSMIGGASGPALEGENTLEAFMRSLSYVLHSDGTGRIGKLDDAVTPQITGNVITFKNATSALCFEEEDTIVLVDPAAVVPPDGMPAYRAYADVNQPLIVTAVDEGAGTVTVNQTINVAIPTAAEGDFVGKWQFFDSQYGLIDGIRRWIPLRQSEALTSWAGVDRAVRPGRRAGWRVLLNANDTPYAVVGKMGAALKKVKGKIRADDDYCMFLPASKIDDLTAEAATQGITFKDARTPGASETLTYGTDQQWATWPGLGRVKFVVDHFMFDPTVSESNDNNYLLTNIKDWDLRMSPDGLGFKQYEDNGGMIKQIPGRDEYYALLGMRGNLFCRRPAFQIQGSTHANE
jgi:hypothetical protein